MHRHIIVAASLLVLATTTSTSTAWAAWGCGHGSSNGIFGVGYGHRTEAQAKKVAFAICGRAGGNGCYVTSCSPKADTEAQGQAIWPQASFGTELFRCGSPGEPKC
jgi:hypothetical protein